jgi:hypothetical protein
MILGGNQPSPVTNKVEIVDLETNLSVCQPATNLPQPSFGNKALLYNNTPIVCGGYRSFLYDISSCYTYQNRSWLKGPELMRARRAHAMTISPFVSDASSLFVTGGLEGVAKPILSVEVLTDSGWMTFSPSLPVPVDSHCMILVNETTAMIVGGKQNGIISSATLVISDEQRQWSLGPPLKTPRFKHVCAMIPISDRDPNKVIITVGGYYSVGLNSAEVLDPRLNSWQSGPALPVGIWDMAITEDPRGGVLIVGGFNGTATKDIYRLRHGAAQWELLKQKLSAPNSFMSAIIIPGELTTNCTIK